MASDRDADAVQTGLGALYERHAHSGFRLAFLLTGDRRAAEDLLHDAFVRVAGRFRHLAFPDAFDTYLRRTIVNLHVSQLRRRRSERAYLERAAGEREEGSSPPDLGLRDELWTALLQLPPRQRAAIILRFYEDLSERRAADVLGWSVEALRSAVARGMRTLRGTIGGEIDDRSRP
jgi:RNA polymerase sigma-70 factor (sigma-E family)